LRLLQPAYKVYVYGIRIGNDFAIVTNPDEYFTQFGLNIKKKSPFRHTMVVEQTNGALGYVPTLKAFAQGGYETWFTGASILDVNAGDMIQDESLDILKKLKSLPVSRG
jgi:neutral ceramidase